MKLSVAETICFPAQAGRGEDAVGATGFGAWVIDGATSLSGVRFSDLPTDAMWAAGKWDQLLRRRLQQPRSDITSILEEGIGEITTELTTLARRAGAELTPLDFPSCCLSAVWIGAGCLHGYTIGDSAIALLGKHDDVQIFYDARVDAFDHIAITAYADKLQRGLPPAAARAEIRDILIANRKRKNMPDGYWILDSSPEAIPHGITFTLPLGSIQTILLCTDGLLQAIDFFNLYPDLHTMAAALLKPPKRALLDLYRQSADVATADPDCRQFPRLKRIDDVAAIVCSLV